jgi:2,4-dienoyl-CoA reductase-like NADH-dependent reductase (Old Yellow Enzyme family)
VKSNNLLEHLLSPFNLAGIRLRNRVIRSATMEGLAKPDGSPSPALRTLYEDLAKGGVGLISTSACLSDRTWSPDPRGTLILDGQADLGAWKETAAAVHQAGAKFSVQLGPFFLLDGRRAGVWSDSPKVHALSTAEIGRIVRTYAAAGARAKDIGADAVQAHGGHGYALAQFLSPLFNRREDAYGGSAAGRARIFVEIRKAIGDTCGPDYPVWIKMNSMDGLPGGLVPEQAREYAPILEQAGFAAIEVTGGSPTGSHDSRGPHDRKAWKEGFYLEGAALVKAHTKLPVATVGGLRRPEMIAQILAEGKADLISLSRPLIREPGLIRRWQSGDLRPADCISCNGCLKMMGQGRGLFCAQVRGEEEDEQEKGEQGKDE